MNEQIKNENERRGGRRESRKARGHRIERNQIKVGEAVNKIRMINSARITKIDEAYKALKLIQWEEFVEAYDELWRGSCYVPLVYSQALDRINAAIERERALLNAYFESLQDDTKV